MVLSETAVLVGISGFGVNMGPFFQCLIMVAALMVISLLHMRFQPYAHAQSGMVMLQGIHCLLFTSLIGQSFLPNGLVLPGSAYGLAMGAFLLVLNCVYVCSVLWQLLRLIDWQALRAALGGIAAFLQKSALHLQATKCVRLRRCFRVLHLQPHTPTGYGKSATAGTSSGARPRPQGGV
jgi:hypothetical protein